jgi:hypothetical protein
MRRFTSFPKRLTGVAAIACAAALAPAAASAATSASDHTTASVPKCGVATPDLRGGAFVWSGNPGDGFAGGVAYELEVTNTGRHSCRVQGVPGLAAIHGGHLVGSKIPASPKGPLVVLKPFQTAHINLIIHAPAVCLHPVGAEVVLYLPGQSRASDTFLSGLACPGKPGGGVLGAGAITAGIPLYTD